MTATAEDELRLVAVHRLVESGLEIAFPLAPGDRPLVEVGESVTAGAPIAEQLRNGALQDQHVPAGPDTRPGGRVQAGELLFEWRGRWRTVGGDVWESIESPVAGTVREATPGSGIVIATAGQAIRGIVALGARPVADCTSRPGPMGSCVPAGWMSAWLARSSWSGRGSTRRR